MDYLETLRQAVMSHWEEQGIKYWEDNDISNDSYPSASEQMVAEPYLSILDSEEEMLNELDMTKKQFLAEN